VVVRREIGGFNGDRCAEDLRVVSDRFVAAASLKFEAVQKLWTAQSPKKIKGDRFGRPWLATVILS
jgi:hypothetical protein